MPRLFRQGGKQGGLCWMHGVLAGQGGSLAHAGKPPVRGGELPALVGGWALHEQMCVWWLLRKPCWYLHSSQGTKQSLCYAGCGTVLLHTTLFCVRGSSAACTLPTRNCSKPWFLDRLHLSRGVFP